MTRVKIYDSEGYEYGREGAKRNEQIASFFTSSVRAIIDASSTSIKMICYFRAREGKGQRTEQFYAEYGAESLKSVYREFKSSVERKAKDLGLEMDYSRESTHILRDIDKADPGYPGLSDTDKRGVKSLIETREKEKLDFGASDYNVATRAAKAAAYRDRVVAISDSGRVSEIKNVDVVFDTGYNGRGLEPSKKTKRKMKDVRRKARQKQVKESLNNVRVELQKLKSLSGKEGVSRSDVNDRLKNIVRNEFPSIFPKPKRRSPTTDKTATRSPRSETGERLKYVVVGGWAIIFLFLALGPLSDSVGFLGGVPVLGDVLPEILKNAIEALIVTIIIAVASVFIKEVAYQTTDGESNWKAPAFVIVVIALVVIVGTVIAGFGSFGGSADPGGPGVPAGNENNNGGTADQGDGGGSNGGGGGSNGNDGGSNGGGGGGNGDGGGGNGDGGGGNGDGGGNEGTSSGMITEDMQSEYENLGSYSVRMTITEGEETEGETINVYSDEGCIKYNATENGGDVKTRVFRNAERPFDMYSGDIDYREDGEWTSNFRTITRSHIGILYGEFIPNRNLNLRGTGAKEWEIKSIEPVSERRADLPLRKRVIARDDSGNEITVEYDNPDRISGLSSSVCQG